jgi:hypothetical protein
MLRFAQPAPPSLEGGGVVSKGMALLARRGRHIETLPIEGHDELALVSEGDVEELLDVLATETFEYVEGQKLSVDVARALARGLLGVTDLGAASEETPVTARSVARIGYMAGLAARIGYMARAAEWERVAAAREPSGSMSAGIREAVQTSVREELAESGTESLHHALAEVTAFFVRREPLDVPYDAKDGFKPMWTIPGMGGDFRALLRDRTLAMALERDREEPDSSSVQPTEEASFENLQRVWKYGFLLRAFEELFQDG